MIEMKAYTSKPVIIQAVRIEQAWFDKRDESEAAIKKLADPNGNTRLSFDWVNGAICVHTLEGDMLAKPGDWIIRGTEGELYPCKDSVFQRKYAPHVPRVECREAAMCYEYSTPRMGVYVCVHSPLDATKRSADLLSMQALFFVSDFDIRSGQHESKAMIHERCAKVADFLGYTPESVVALFEDYCNKREGRRRTMMAEQSEPPPTKEASPTA